MLYPKCPKCGGTTETAEPDGFERGACGAGQMLRLAQHRHPYLKIAHLAATVGRELYKSVPGGGEKACLNPACGHRFR